MVRQKQSALLEYILKMNVLVGFSGVGGTDLLIGMHDFGPERHNGTQHWDRPKYEEHTGRLHSSQPLKLDQERG